MPAPWFSPDGRYTVDVNSIEMRMSHWVDRPFILDEYTHEMVLDFGDCLWSVDQARWSDDSTRVTLVLRRYPGNIPGVEVDVDIPKQVVEIHYPDTVGQATFATLMNALESYAHSQPNLSRDWY